MRRKVLNGLWLLVLAACLVFPAGIYAADFPDITAKDLKAKLDGGEKLFLLNPLSDIEFNEGHIQGTVNIPLDAIANTDKLPADKGILIITYCLGPK
jgi:hypothetical protein